MTEPQTAQEAAKATQEDRDFMGVLKALVGKKVTVVNPESYESVPMGYQLKEGHYPGKIAGWGEDYLIFHTTVTLGKKEGGPQVVQQYIPISRIKRISAMNANKD